MTWFKFARDNFVTILLVIGLVVGALGVWKFAGSWFQPKIDSAKTEAMNEGMAGDSAAGSAEGEREASGLVGDYRAERDSSRESRVRTNDRISSLPSSKTTVPSDVAAVLRQSDRELRDSLRSKESGSGDRR